MKTQWNWGLIWVLVALAFFWLGVAVTVLWPESEPIYGTETLPVESGELWRLNPV